MNIFRILFLGMTLMLLTVGQSYAGMMNDPGTGNGPMDNGNTNGGGPWNGGPMMNGSIMQNNGSFGMMNGIAGGPVVADDGTAYFVVTNPTAKPGKTPTSMSFTSQIIAVGTSGTVDSVGLDGLVSRPVLTGNALIATASLPNMGDYNVVENGSANSGAPQSVLYAISLPLTSTSVPAAVTLDGGYASIPVVAGSYYYVSTTNFGSSMMQGNNMFNNMYGKYNYSKTGSATYLYVINPDLTIASKVQIQ